MNNSQARWGNRVQEVDNAKEQLENYIETKGEYMIDITNGNTYLVQYLKSLSKLVGKDYAVCAPVRQNGTYGAFYVKPYNTFQKKAYQPSYNSPQPSHPKLNLYRRLGLDK